MAREGICVAVADPGGAESVAPPPPPPPFSGRFLFFGRFLFYFGRFFGNIFGNLDFRPIFSDPGSATVLHGVSALLRGCQTVSRALLYLA